MSQTGVILNIVTITEIYVLCVNDSDLKRWSSLKHWYSIQVVGNVSDVVIQLCVIERLIRYQ